MVVVENPGPVDADGEAVASGIPVAVGDLDGEIELLVRRGLRLAYAEAADIELASDPFDQDLDVEAGGAGARCHGVPFDLVIASETRDDRRQAAEVDIDVRVVDRSVGVFDLYPVLVKHTDCADFLLGTAPQTVVDESALLGRILHKEGRDLYLRRGRGLLLRYGKGRRGDIERPAVFDIVGVVGLGLSQLGFDLTREEVRINVGQVGEEQTLARIDVLFVDADGGVGATLTGVDDVA